MAKGNKKVPPAARGGGSDFDNLKSPLAALGVFIAAVLLVAFIPTILTVWRSIVGTMHTLDVTDTVKMKEVLFGGEPWILYCSDKPGEVSSELNEVCGSGIGDTTVSCGKVQCNVPMSSGKTLMDRFKLRDLHPMVFVAANGDAGHQLSAGYLNKKEHLVAKLKDLTQPKIHGIHSLKMWEKSCVNRKSCVVVAYKRQIPQKFNDAILKALGDNRGIRVASMDRSNWSLKIPSEDLLEQRPKKSKIDIVCIHKQGDDAIPSGVFFTGSAKSQEEVSSFLYGCHHGTSDKFIQMEEMPEFKKKEKDAPAPAPEPEEETDVEGWDELLGDDDDEEEEEEEGEEEEEEENEEN